MLIVANIIDSNPERQRDKQRDLSNKLLYLNMFDHLSSKREREGGKQKDLGEDFNLTSIHDRFFLWRHPLSWNNSVFCCIFT